MPHPDFLVGPVKYKIDDHKLELTLVFEIAGAVQNKTLEVVNSLTAIAVTEELSKSTEFQEMIRKFALAKIMAIASNEPLPVRKD